MPEIYDARRASKAQNDLCVEKRTANYAPSSGVCWSCHRNIYEPVHWGDDHTTGYTVKYASMRLISGCPHCRRSFCD